MDLLDRDALRETLRDFVTVGTLVLDLGPIGRGAARVVMAAEHDGSVRLTCERSSALAALLGVAREACVHFRRDGLRFELSGSARYEAEDQSGPAHCMMVELTVSRATLPDGPWQPGLREADELDESEYERVAEYA